MCKRGEAPVHWQAAFPAFPQTPQLIQRSQVWQGQIETAWDALIGPVLPFPSPPRVLKSKVLICREFTFGFGHKLQAVDASHGFTELRDSPSNLKNDNPLRRKAGRIIPNIQAALSAEYGAQSLEQRSELFSLPPAAWEADSRSTEMSPRNSNCVRRGKTEEGTSRHQSDSLREAAWHGLLNPIYSAGPQRWFSDLLPPSPADGAVVHQGRTARPRVADGPEAPRDRRRRRTGGFAKMLHEDCNVCCKLLVGGQRQVKPYLKTAPGGAVEQLGVVGGGYDNCVAGQFVNLHEQRRDDTLDFAGFMNVSPFLSYRIELIEEKDARRSASVVEYSLQARSSFTQIASDHHLLANYILVDVASVIDGFSQRCLSSAGWADEENPNAWLKAMCPQDVGAALLFNQLVDSLPRRFRQDQVFQSASRHHFGNEVPSPLSRPLGRYWRGECAVAIGLNCLGEPFS